MLKTPTNPTTAKRLRAAAVSVAALAGFSVASSGNAAAGQFIQNIFTQSAAGSGRMIQYITRDTQAPSLTRVCILNRSSRDKIFAHAQSGINTLRAPAYGGRSCANFPSNARVHFALFDDGQPVTASVNMVMSLSAFAGGRVDFLWGK